MEEEEYNDIVTYIQDQNYPQNTETSNVLIYKYHHSILVKKIMKRRVKIKKICTPQPKRLRKSNKRKSYEYY